MLFLSPASLSSDSDLPRTEPLHFLLLPSPMQEQNDHIIKLPFKDTQFPEYTSILTALLAFGECGASQNEVNCFRFQCTVLEYNTAYRPGMKMPGTKIPNLGLSRAVRDTQSPLFPCGIAPHSQAQLKGRTELPLCICATRSNWVRMQESKGPFKQKTSLQLVSVLGGLERKKCQARLNK